jgi:chemotaxis protein CheZ
MKMDSAETLGVAAPPVAESTVSPTEVFIQVGTITRLLHDTLAQLGVMPSCRRAADGIPDARSRLNYIAEKTASAADKVLNSVDQPRPTTPTSRPPRASSPAA